MPPLGNFALLIIFMLLLIPMLIVRSVPECVDLSGSADAVN